MTKPPVIYSILVMRDDDSVTSFRMRAMWIKLAVTGLVLLTLVCAGAVAGGVYLFTGYRDAVAERERLEVALSQSTARLNALNSRTPLDRLDRLDAPGGLDGPQNLQSSPVVASNGATAPTMSSIVQAQPVPQGRGGAADNGRAAPSPEELQRILDSAPAAPAPAAPVVRGVPAGVGGASEESSAERQVTVRNFKLARNGEGNLRASFELSNRTPGSAVSGECFLSLLDRDGKEVPVELAKGSLRFQISRFRRMEASFPLPDGMEAPQIRAVRFKASGSGLVAYSKDFDVTLR